MVRSRSRSKTCSTPLAAALFLAFALGDHVAFAQDAIVEPCSTDPAKHSTEVTVQKRKAATVKLDGCSSTDLLVIEIAEPSNTVPVALYLKWGAQARSHDFDRAADVRGATRQRMVIAHPRMSDPYLRIEGHFDPSSSVPDDESRKVMVTAKSVSIAVDGLSLGGRSVWDRHMRGYELGHPIPELHCGEDTFRTTITGAGFDDTTEFGLAIPGTGGFVWSMDPHESVVVSSFAADVLFRAKGAPPGAGLVAPLELVATRKSDGEEAALSNALRIIEPCAVWPALGVRIDAPALHRSDRIGRFYVHYTNHGNAVMEPRLLRVDVAPKIAAGGCIAFRLDDDENGQELPPLQINRCRGDPVWILTTGVDGRTELAPGETGTVSFEFRTSITGATEPAALNTLVISVDELMPNLKDEGIAIALPALDELPQDVRDELLGGGQSRSDAQLRLGLAVRSIEDQVCDRWANVAPFLAERATCLRRLGIPGFSVTKILGWVLREELGIANGVISGVAFGPDGGPLDGRVVVLRETGGGPEVARTTTSPLGDFVFRGVADGHYDVGSDVMPSAASNVSVGSSCGVVLEIDLPEDNSETQPPLDFDRGFGTLVRESVAVSLRDQQDVRIGVKSDPNEVIGPGPPGDVVGNGQLWYTVRAENSGHAIDPVSELRVADRVDAARYDFSSLEFKHVDFAGKSYWFGCPYGFGVSCFYTESYYPGYGHCATIWPVPTLGGPSLPCRFRLAVQAWPEQVSCPQLGSIPCPAARVDLILRQCDNPTSGCYLPNANCRWSSHSGCPGDSNCPAPSDGFLPPNDSAGAGEAAVSYTIALNSGFYGGDVPKDAFVRFDADSCNTNSSGAVGCWTCPTYHCYNAPENCGTSGTSMSPRCKTLQSGGSCDSATCAFPLGPPEGRGGGFGKALVFDPPAPRFPRPADSAPVDRGTNFLAWEDIPGATRYEVRLWRGTSCADEPDNEPERTDDPVLCVELEESDAQYFWRVDAFFLDETDPDGPVEVMRSSPCWKLFTVAPVTRTFVRGDVNADGGINIVDPMRVLNYVFLKGSGFPCFAAADADDNESIAISDAVLLLSFLFLGGPPPEAPYPDCGAEFVGDPGDESSLDCEEYEPCKCVLASP